MSIRRMMLFTLGGFFKSIISLFKTRVLSVGGNFEAETNLENQLNALGSTLFDSASLIITPNAYKEQTLYSIKPDKIGNNSLLWSEQFDNSYWYKVRCSIVSNQEIAPDGSLTADYVVEDSTTGLRYIGRMGIPTSIGQTYTFSVFVKKKDRSQIMLQIGEGNSLYPTVVFDFDSQVFTQTTPLLTSSFQSVGNGWFRIILTRTPTTGTSSIIGIFPINVNGQYSGTGDGVSRTIIWGAQLELGSTATDYISTTDRAIVNGTIGDLTVTRATTATRVNEQGLIEIPRTNLLLQSNMFDNPLWVKDSSFISPNDQISPDGTLTADTFTANGTTNVHQIYQNGNVTSGITYTNSIFAKKGTNDFIQLTGGNAAFGLNSFANFDLNNGTVGTVGSTTTASIQNIGNGWYRCIVTFTAISTTSVAPILLFIVNSSSAVKAQSNNLSTSVYLWGAQVEQGVTATEYIPTTSVIRTRFAGITQDGGSASNIPRIDYTTGSPAILVEPQRTNLFLWSEKFYKTSWGKFSLSVTPNTTLSPSGFVNADTITSTNINTIFLLQLITITSGTIYSISFYVKQNTQRFVYIRFTSNATSQNYVSAVFDLQDGTVGQTSVGTTSGTLISSNVRNAGNGFYRVSITASINVTDGNIGIGFAPSKTGNTFSASGTITSNVVNGGSIFVWGAQLEAGSNATSYIPTTTSIVTRNADVISNTNASNLIGQTEGTILIKGAQFDRGVVLRIRNNTNISVNRLMIFGVDTGGNVEVGVMKNNVTVSTVYYLNVKKKNIIMVYSQNIFKVFINGQLIYQYNYPISTNFTAVLNTIEFGSLSEMGTANFDFISLWKTQLTDQQAIQLTTL